MTTRTLGSTAISAAALTLLLGVGGTPALADPGALRVPEQVTCIHLPAVLSGIETKGLFKVESETRLERGPYISEGEDAEGTYYRAPPGGVYQGPPKNKPANGAWQLDRDGGIFVPRDPSAPPQLYSYASENGTSAATLVPPATADCTNTTYVRDPNTKAVRVAAYQGEGATATDAKRVGVAGGSVIGYALNELVEGRNMGRIVRLPQSKNAEFNARLGEFARNAVPIKAEDAQD
ncbi:hypothetical protein HAV22_28260 [Massilia sp. TW-1]|uniref:Secreted protein n=1 Tax=Telluria antibiotica TaxID=2717319 RepID=A0ABX0PJN6_9BURK|nr:hypothetical protein [Telluria antibiotica]NIA57526.1 hypothetical protein [Telluria antibiotica]